MLIRTRLAALVSAGALVAGTLVLGSPSASSLPLPGSDDLFRPQLVTVDTPSRDDKALLQSLGLDLTEHAGHDYIEVVLHSAADLSRLTSSGLSHTVRIDDLVRRSAEINAEDERYAATTATSALPSTRTAYRTLAEYDSDLAELAGNHPGLVELFTLPHRSLEGRDILGVEIGSDVGQAETGRPVFLLMGLHHAREWPSGELAMEFATDLAKSYGADARITDLLDRARVIVVPVVNPDGFDLSRTDGGVIDLRDLNDLDPLGGTTSVIATPGHAYKRKNCRVLDGQTFPAGTCRATLTSNLGAGVGVDLNRNYGGLWGGPGAAGPEPDPLNVGLGVLDPTYRGVGPFSEPETQNVRELVSSRHVTMMISNHTYSNLILRPNGVHPDTIGPDGHPVGDAPDEKALKDLGAKMAAANGYANIHGWELYDTTGTTEDWSYNATGGFGYTFEIGEHEFHPPYAEVVDEYVGAGQHAGKGNREAYLIALEHAIDPATHAVLDGQAPAGAELRLTKEFQTPTWEGSFDDAVDTTITVGASGQFSWHVNPSTRPVVMPRTYREYDEPFRSETFEGTAPAPTAHNDHEFVVTESADVLGVNLDWATPDDYDLEVYRRDPDGLTPVGSSGNLPGQKEKVTVHDPQPGTYVLRVVNYAALAPYTLTAELFDAQTVSTEGATESYELTCAVGGEVKVTRTVIIDRGETGSVDLSDCGPVDASGPTPPGASPGTFARTKKPAIKGKARVGKLLRATTGTWSPTPTRVSFRWLRNGRPIKGATKRGYVLRKKDRGKRVNVRVTVSRATYHDAVAKARAVKVRKAR